MNPARHLRDILAQEKTILAPGAYDAFNDKILKQAGFKIELDRSQKGADQKDTFQKDAPLAPSLPCLGC